jgi:hypothetical protein
VAMVVVIVNVNNAIAIIISIGNRSIIVAGICGGCGCSCGFVRVLAGWICLWGDEELRVVGEELAPLEVVVDERGLLCLVEEVGWTVRHTLRLLPQYAAGCS